MRDFLSSRCLPNKVFNLSKLPVVPGKFSNGMCSVMSFRHFSGTGNESLFPLLFLWIGVPWDTDNDDVEKLSEKLLRRLVSCRDKDGESLPTFSSPSISSDSIESFTIISALLPSTFANS